MHNILVVGWDGGLGKEVMHQMEIVGNVQAGAFNVMDENAIYKFMEWQSPFDMVVYCAGVNLISTFDDIEAGDFWESMDVNCYGFIRLIKIMREKNKLNPCAVACIVTSNAANIAMSHSLSYNCSKAAANIMVRQMGRELDVKELTVFGVAPNKLEGTPMSKAIEEKVCEMRGWSEVEAAQYQLAALPAGHETSPKDCALFIRQLFQHSSILHGTVVAYGGPQ